MASISILSAPEWAYLDDSITVQMSWESDIPAYSFVGIFPDLLSYGFGEFLEAGTHEEEVIFVIHPDNRLVGNEIWAVLLDEEGNVISEWEGPVPIEILEPEIPEGAPTAAPVLVAPANNSTVNTGQPTFSWQEVELATSYDYIVRDVNKAWIDGFTTGLSFSPATPLPNGQYFWKIRAKNSFGPGPWSSEWTVNIATAVLPPPNLLSPANNSSHSTTPTLRWSSVAGRFKYHLQVATSSNFAPPLEYNVETAETNYTPGFMRDGTYFWRVRTKDFNLNYGSWSTVFKFIIETEVPPGVPGKPTLFRPANQSTHSSIPEFKWNPVTNATKYHLEVANDKPFKNKYVDVEITGTSYTPSDIEFPLGPMYWAVRAKNANGYGKWSDTWEFTMIAPPTKPTPIPKPKAFPLGLVAIAGGLALAVLLSRKKWKK